MATFQQLKAAQEEAANVTRQHRTAMFEIFEAVRAAFWETLDPPVGQLGLAPVRFSSSQNTATAPHLWEDEKTQPFGHSPFKPLKKADAAENFVILLPGARAEAEVGIACLPDEHRTLDVPIAVWREDDGWWIRSGETSIKLSADEASRQGELVDFAVTVTDRLLADVPDDN